MSARLWQRFAVFNRFIATERTQLRGCPRRLDDARIAPTEAASHMPYNFSEKKVQLNTRSLISVSHISRKNQHLDLTRFARRVPAADVCVPTSEPAIARRDDRPNGAVEGHLHET